ncbi:MAG: hypothetical protein GY811_16890 [Myxococcales bacterium]|nr:hypothetical protein [Myxococcales bacterium]
MTTFTRSELRSECHFWRPSDREPRWIDVARTSHPYFRDLGDLLIVCSESEHRDSWKTGNRTPWVAFDSGSSAFDAFLPYRRAPPDAVPLVRTVLQEMSNNSTLLDGLREAIERGQFEIESKDDGLLISATRARFALLKLRHTGVLTSELNWGLAVHAIEASICGNRQSESSTPSPS